MQLILLGMVFGGLTSAMPGPVNVSLVQVGAAQGRASGLRAGIGVFGGDGILAVTSLLVVSAGASLPGAAFSAIQFVTALFLIGFGLVLIGRPAFVEEQSSEVRHPLRTFLLITALMPTAFGSWIAMLSAMPFASERASLCAFALGVMITSALWHPVLGTGAGLIGPRLTPRALRIGTRVGGVATLLLGVWSLLSR